MGGQRREDLAEDEVVLITGAEKCTLERAVRREIDDKALRVGGRSLRGTRGQDVTEQWQRQRGAPDAA